MRKITSNPTKSPPLWDGQKFTSQPKELESLYRSDREHLWTTPRNTHHAAQLKAIDWYITEVTKGRAVEVPQPSREEVLNAIRQTKDSAAGIDDVPYAFWRLICDRTADIILRIFECADACPLRLLGKAPVSEQALVFIGKKNPSVLAKGQRPLGLPTTFHRILSSVWFSTLTRAFASHLQLGQTLLAGIAETHFNHERLQVWIDEGIALSNTGGHEVPLVP